MSVLRLCDMQNRATRSLEPSDIVKLWSRFCDKNDTKTYENDIVGYATMKKDTQFSSVC